MKIPAISTKNIMSSLSFSALYWSSMTKSNRAN